MPDSLRLWVDRQRDPDGARLRETLAAHFASERMQALSQIVAFLLVPVGAVVWVAAVLPRLMPAWAAHLGEAAWGLGAIGLIIAVAKGHRYGKQASRLAAQARPPAPEDR